MSDHQPDQGLIALVTGANRGLGLAIAKGLGQRGFTVLCGVRSSDTGRETCDTLLASGIDAHPLLMNVTDPPSLEHAAADVAQRFGRLDVLVNNAGISLDKGSQPSTADLVAMREVFEVNVFGVVATIQAMLPLLRQSPVGRIVNMSTGLASLTLTRGPDGPMRMNRMLAYNASKAALNAVTVQFANELADTPIKVNAANPGLCATALSNGQGQPPEEGARIAIRLATLDPDGPTGGFFAEAGAVPW